MSEQLKDFLTNLSTDSELQESFKEDAAGTMRKHGVSEEHIDLVVNEKFDDLKKVLGVDELTTIHGTIHIVKK